MKKIVLITAKKETEEKHKQFIESRKKSIKNEFSIVKELMKNNKNLMEEKTDIEEKKENKRKFRNTKSTKKMVNKSKMEVKKSITVIKEPKRKKLYEEENYDNNIYKKKLRKRKNVEKKELDIDMKENSQNNEEIITDFLPCREQEQEQIKNYIKEGLEINGNYNSLYIAGMPGTGKTVCVKRVIKILENEFKETLMKFSYVQNNKNIFEWVFQKDEENNEEEEEEEDDDNNNNEK